MQNLYILTVFILSHVAVSAQTAVPIDYHNRIVEMAQSISAETFLSSLEQGKTDDALKLIDSSLFRSKPKFKKNLTAYHQELSKYLSTTTLSTEIVYLNKKYNTYRCRYHNKKGDYFCIDLDYNKGQSNSKITRITKRSKQELAKERKALAKQAKENDGTGTSRSAKSSSAGVKQAKKHEGAGTSRSAKSSSAGVKHKAVNKTTRKK